VNPLPTRTNAVSIYCETAQVETCAAVKANFSANFDVYSNISDAETLENSCNQFSAMFSQIYSGITGITGRNLLYIDNNDLLGLLSQTRSITTATVQ